MHASTGGTWKRSISIVTPFEIMRVELDRMREGKEQKLGSETNAYRLLAEDVLWSGVAIDSLAGRYLVSLRNAELPREAEEWLCAQEADIFIKHLEKGEKHSPQPLRKPRHPLQFSICENGVRFMMDMGSGYSQGLFIDQRNNRLDLRRNCQEGMTVLNLFAYTGAFSVCAALGGATTTTLDLAANCLNRCKENMRINGINPSVHYFCRGDALHWLRRFAQQGRLFDCIVMDPPTFSRDSRTGGIWRAEKDYSDLVALATQCLSTGGSMLCTTNSRRLTPETFRTIVATGAGPAATLSSVPMPFDFFPETYLKSVKVTM